jgi:tellurite resistance protein
MNEIAPTSRLQHFPITLLPSVMGLLGLAIVWMKFQHMFHVGVPVGQAIMYATTVYFALVVVMQGVRFARYPEEVAKDFRHPIRVNFFPALSICFLLLSISWLEAGQVATARIFWYIGAPLHLGFLLVILHGWFHKDYDLKFFNPAWFIPVVGPLLVPVAGVEFAHPEVSWFFFSIGIVYWIVLLAVLVGRVFFHSPMAPKLLPTLFILIAPPAVGFIAYGKLTAGPLDNFGRILFYFGVFNVLMLVTMLGKLRKVPFFLSWWGYTFPLDAFTLSVVMMFGKTKLPFFRQSVAVLTVITTLVILLVLIKTLLVASRRQLCVPED